MGTRNIAIVENGSVANGDTGSPYSQYCHLRLLLAIENGCHCHNFNGDFQWRHVFRNSHWSLMASLLPLSQLLTASIVQCRLGFRTLIKPKRTLVASLRIANMGQWRNWWSLRQCHQCRQWATVMTRPLKATLCNCDTGAKLLKKA